MGKLEKLPFKVLFYLGFFIVIIFFLGLKTKRIYDTKDLVGKPISELDLKILLPNIITLSGLSFGLSSIRFALESDFNLAIICILFAGLCDVLDGMLARHLQSESDLGAQLDSLSDFLSFGIAPGLLIYMSIFNQESIGAFACLLYTSPSPRDS